MEVLPFTDSEKIALGRLLDDPSPVVRQSLLALFSSHGRESVALLQELARRPHHGLARPAAQYLHELHFPDPVGEFRSFIRSLNYELESGALLLSRTINANLDVGACCSQLDAMAARCRALISEPATAREKCRALNRVLFHEFGLRGNTEQYDDPLNSFLDQVLIRRKGLPISLSMVYLLVGERVGLPLEPVALPGHFLVGCYEENSPFYIDPFQGGTFLTAREVFILARQSGTHASFADLAPTPVREVLCRCCRNLAHHYAASDHPDNAELFAGFAAEFESTYERHARS